jgi:hypothetical protein
MLRLLTLSFVGLWLSASQAFAIDCMRPLPPEIPDGSTASRDEMVAASDAIQVFVDESERYLDCLKVQESLIPPNELSAQRQALMAQQHNAAVTGMETVASRYNEAVRAYKENLNTAE